MRTEFDISQRLESCVQLHKIDLLLSNRACYDEGKRIAETLVSGYAQMSNVSVRIARIFNTYGPR